MATKKKMLQAAAGNAGGAGLDVAEVFSTYLYTGGISGVTNGIDLAGEGGMVWGKSRTGTGYPWIFDTERGHSKWLYTNDNAAEQSGSIGITSFNSDGFNLTGTSTFFNSGTHDYASWTFRKAPKFFDVVTYTGDGVDGRTISHDLGCDVGMIIIKSTTSGSDGWIVWHRTFADFSTGSGHASLNLTNEAYDSVGVNRADIASSTQITLSAHTSVNDASKSYVMYIFAHNDGDGEFGPSGDQDIIKCGSYTGDGSGLATVDLGFEPQWVMIKRAGTTSNWEIIDTMRGFPTNPIGAGTADNARLFANLSNAESGFPMLGLTSTGFVTGASWGAGEEVIYIAIRRGPLAQPESGTEVFDVDAQNGGSFVNTPFPVDFQINKNRTFASGAVAISRLTGGRALDTSSTGAEGGASYFEFDHQNGIEDNYQGIDGCIYWSFKRAPNFFDSVCYTGNGVAGRTVSHNLGVAPEMMWVKDRNGGASWYVYHSGLDVNGDGLPETDVMRLNFNIAAYDDVTSWNDTAPTDTVFTLGFGHPNTSSYTYIAYLFATLPGVSKVGSYTGNGTSQTIDCGFTSGARFILIKRTDSTGDWYVWDTERGIVAGNDPHLSLNTTAAEVTSDDSIDPDNSGFIVNQLAATNINVSSASYIFYSVA